MSYYSLPANLEWAMITPLSNWLVLTSVGFVLTSVGFVLARVATCVLE